MILSAPPVAESILVLNTSRNFHLDKVIEAINHLSTFSPGCWFGHVYTTGLPVLHEWMQKL